MTVKMAHSIGFFLCEHCSSVHIGMWRNGEMFAEAIPDNPEMVVAEMQAAIAESNERRGIAPKSVLAHKH